MVRSVVRLKVVARLKVKRADSPSVMVGPAAMLRVAELRRHPFAGEVMVGPAAMLRVEGSSSRMVPVRLLASGARTTCCVLRVAQVKDEELRGFVFLIIRLP